MATERMISPTQLKDAYRKIIERIENAAQRSGRKASDIIMVAVTKNATPDQIRTLVEMGHMDLGENRVQHLAHRVAQLEEFLSRKRTLAGAAPKSASETPEYARWHMVGHLQRNKVKQVVPLVNLIHSIDSLRLAEEIHNYASRMDRVVDILIQVNSAEEPGKAGVAPPAVTHLAEQIDTMMHLRSRGLMTMAPYSEEPEDARNTFARTAEIFEELRSEKIGGGECNILSMGMTGDFEVAVEEGANVLRIGRGLFGEIEP